MAQNRQYYSELEKAILTELVRKYRDILEDKKNDYRSIKRKMDTWETVREEFNSQSGVNKRDPKQFKKCWENLKARAKKHLAKEKKVAKFMTGGGPSTSNDGEEASAVASIIPAQIESLDNVFDDDNYESGMEIDVLIRLNVHL